MKEKETIIQRHHYFVVWHPDRDDTYPKYKMITPPSTPLPESVQKLSNPSSDQPTVSKEDSISEATGGDNIDQGVNEVTGVGNTRGLSEGVSA